MIHSSKVPAALYAIHNILYMARYYVGEGMDSKSLYKLMDWAEILPSLLVRVDGDTTEEFRSYLEGIGEEYALLSGLLTRFDQGETWPGATVEFTGNSVTAAAVSTD